MRFTNTIISSVSTLALVSNALPIGGIYPEDSAMMESLFDGVSKYAIANNRLPQSAEVSSQEDDGIDFSDPFKIQEILLNFVKRGNSDFDPSGLVETLHNYRPNAAIPVSSVDDEEVDGEGELGEAFAELGDKLGTALSSFAAKRADLPILGESGKGLTQGLGPLAGESGGEKPSSDAVSKSALQGGITSLLQGGGPGMSGLPAPLSDGDILSSLTNKRKVGRAPLTVPTIKLILPDSQDLKELPNKIPTMIKNRIGGRTVAEIAKRQLGNLSFDKVTKAATEAVLGKLGVQNGSASQARRSERVSTPQSSSRTSMRQQEEEASEVL